MEKKIKIRSIFLSVIVIIVTGYFVLSNIQKECNSDEDCQSLECPHRYELGCTSIQFVAKKCIDNKCVCKCEVPDYDLPKPPSEEKIEYKGKIYVRTDEKYYKYIPDEFKVELEDGTSIYFFNNSVYTLYAADPRHGSYIYVKWMEEK